MSSKSNDQGRAFEKLFLNAIQALMPLQELGKIPTKTFKIPF